MGLARSTSPGRLLGSLLRTRRCVRGCVEVREPVGFDPRPVGGLSSSSAARTVGWKRSQRRAQGLGAGTVSLRLPQPSANHTPDSPTNANTLGSTHSGDL